MGNFRLQFKEMEKRRKGPVTSSVKDIYNISESSFKKAKKEKTLKAKALAFSLEEARLTGKGIVERSRIRGMLEKERGMKKKSRSFFASIR